jgi:hypothetical protein
VLLLLLHLRQLLLIIRLLLLLLHILLDILRHLWDISLYRIDGCRSSLTVICLKVLSSSLLRRRSVGVG